MITCGVTTYFKHSLLSTYLNTLRQQIFLFCTIKHGKAVLGCGGQRFAGGVQLVTIVPNADFKLDGLTRLLEHAGAVENGAQREFPPPLVFLKAFRKDVCLRGLHAAKG